MALIPTSSLVAGGFDPSWDAPESLGEEDHAAQPVDIWKFGCVCYEVWISSSSQKPVGFTI